MPAHAPEADLRWGASNADSQEMKGIQQAPTRPSSGPRQLLLHVMVKLYNRTDAEITLDQIERIKN
jgi:hypothetical protein